MTIFTLDITRVTLDAECNGYPLGAEMQDTTPRRQDWGKRKQYDLEYHITNTKFLAYLKEIYLRRQRLNWRFRITWNLKTALYGRELSPEHDFTFLEVPDLSQREIDAL